ncbi:DUF1534 domain-containing protein [Pseudomonas tremae]|nr:DUF1534 domain-containing protein [Pseudomonas tremae]MCF5745723.1 DUF1534 domain-containing protein [Pseudomonas tremae]
MHDCGSTRPAGLWGWIERTATDYRANARWHAVRDALRHKSVPLCTLNSGRRASRNAFPRKA